MNLENIKKKLAPLGEQRLNVYLFSWEGLCMSERQGSIRHEPLIGLTIEELALLQKDWLLHFRTAQKGKGVSWFSNTNNILSFAGFIPISEDQVIIGYSIALQNNDEPVLNSNDMNHLPPNW